MGVPIIDIKFEQLTSTAVRRSARGIVALLLEDSTEGGAATETFQKDETASEGWSAESLRYIRMAKQSGADKVTAIRVSTGMEDAPDYAAALATAGALKWNWLAAPQAAQENVAEIATFIRTARKNGGTYKAVLAGSSLTGCEGTVNLAAEGIKSVFFGTEESFTAGEYTARVAGVLAGLELTKSVTGMEFDDITDMTARTDPDGDVDSGKFIFTFNGESYEAARGVTTATEDNVLRKIKNVEGMDLIREDIKLIFASNYRGKKVNTYDNKALLMADLVTYFKGLEGSVTSGDFESTASIDLEAQAAYLQQKGMDTETMTEAEILRANTDDKVFAKANIQLADAMEDIFITVVLN